jgi:hypothetical protein
VPEPPDRMTGMIRLGCRVAMGRALAPPRCGAEAFIRQAG